MKYFKVWADMPLIDARAINTYCCIDNYPIEEIQKVCLRFINDNAEKNRWQVLNPDGEFWSEEDKRIFYQERYGGWYFISKEQYEHE